MKCVFSFSLQFYLKHFSTQEEYCIITKILRFPIKVPDTSVHFKTEFSSPILTNAPPNIKCHENHEAELFHTDKRMVRHGKVNM
jgi:hypothetical protein